MATPPTRYGPSTFRKQIGKTKRSRKIGRETWTVSSSLYVSGFPSLAVFLIFFSSTKTGLFAATVAAFCFESYKRLSSVTGAASVLLLNQISQQLSALSNGTQIPPPPLYDDSSFCPTARAIRINVLWFLSLILSLVCALAATLMQQRARRYLQLVQAQAPLYKRARTLGVSLRRCARISPISGRRGRTGIAPCGRVPLLPGPCGFPVLRRQHSWRGHYRGHVYLWCYLHPPHVSPERPAQLSVRDAIQPGLAQVVPRCPHSTGTSRNLLLTMRLAKL